ncbi:MAG: septal ring lytic transglycosylase RlpA family protein [Myxococcaceae bacterium]|nr:septal ring lytic transglycosylase RlpA family protein [Myxococcaceae bacterium]
MVAHRHRARASHRRLALVLLLVACAPKAVRPAPAPRADVPQGGLASFYGEGFDGKLTASGERFDRTAFTAAHKTLPFDTCVRVTVVETGKSVEVRVNDRGPFVAGRVIDVSEGAARALGIVEQGVAQVRLQRCD